MMGVLCETKPEEPQITTTTEQTEQDNQIEVRLSAAPSQPIGLTTIQ